MHHIEESMHVGDGDKLLDFFTNSLGKLGLRGGGFWKNKATNFMPHLQHCFPYGEEDEEDVIFDGGKNQGGDQDKKPGT